MSEEHDWEYMEMALAEYREQESHKHFERMPEICKRCRWLDWYYLEECTYKLWPKDNRCSMYCRDYNFIFNQSIPSFLRILWWDIQYRLWKFTRYLQKATHG